MKLNIIALFTLRPELIKMAKSPERSITNNRSGSVGQYVSFDKDLVHGGTRRMRPPMTGQVRSEGFARIQPQLKPFILYDGIKN